MAKARIACESARALLDREDSDAACDRANYAMFLTGGHRFALTVAAVVPPAGGAGQRYLPAIDPRQQTPRASPSMMR
jgi:hypothetical protein